MAYPELIDAVPVPQPRWISVGVHCEMWMLTAGLMHLWVHPTENPKPGTGPYTWTITMTTTDRIQLGHGDHESAFQAKEECVKQARLLLSDMANALFPGVAAQLAIRSK